MKKDINYFVLLVFLLFGLTRCVGLRPNPKYNEPSSSEKRAPDSDNGNGHAISRGSNFESKLADAIESYLGVPYKFGGATRSGMDCSGFVSIVYTEAVGMTLPHRARSMFKMGRPVERNRLQMGDLVFFENIENYGVSHVGIFVGDGRFAHASTSRGVVISDLSQDYYRERYVGAKRVYWKQKM
ncbi:MAG: C40 family peptidase [bacterium]